MSLTAKVEGVERLKKKLAALPLTTQKPIQDAIRGGALAVEREAKTMVQRGQRSGRIYQRGAKIHIASAPGEPPKSDTGYLAGHITTQLDADGLGASVESQAEYSKALEFGTSKMAARPFLFPAFERWKARIRERLAQAINGAFKKAGR